MLRKSKSGFTLIELLVVIAIIAILAAILFPVFAQAREKARQSQCLSNAKQIASAVTMYQQDYDEMMPLFFNGIAGGANRRSWAGLVQPYVSNWGVFRCPTMVDGTVPGSGENLWHSRFATPSNLSLWPGYGWNMTYMNHAASCSEFNTKMRSGPPTPLALISKPAETVMLVGISLAPGQGSLAGKDTLHPVRGGYYAAEAPATHNSPTGCTWRDGSWGQGSYGGPYGGFEQPRHGDMGGTVCFADGHVKFMTAGQLAAGTDWNVNKRNSEIKITDLNRYLWDLE